MLIFSCFTEMERDIFASPIEPLFNHEFALETEILQDWLIILAKKNTNFINQAHSKQVPYNIKFINYTALHFRGAEWIEE